MAMVCITRGSGGIEGERAAVEQRKPNQYGGHMEGFHLVDILEASFIGWGWLGRPIKEALEIATFHTLMLRHTVHEIIQGVIELLLMYHLETHKMHMEGVVVGCEVDDAPHLGASQAGCLCHRICKPPEIDQEMCGFIFRGCEL